MQPTTVELPKCQSCNRPMRPFNTHRADYPDTVSRANINECGSCQRARKNGAPRITRFKLTPGTACNGCKRPLRPAGTSIGKYPDTVPHQGRGLCSGCYANNKIGRPPVNSNRPAPRPRFQTGTPCLGCRTPLRPRGTPRKAHPDTIAHHAAGLCHACYRVAAEGQLPAFTRKEQAEARRRETVARLAPAPQGLTGQDLTNRQGLDNLIERRRRRGIPAVGLDLKTWIKRNGVSA